MKLILVRHGQTVYNAISRYQGHTDTDLSELGFRQAELVGRRLKDEKIDAVYASDLSRAGDTGQAIANHHGLTVKTDERLRECSFGEWEGLLVDEIAEQYPELYSNYRRDSLTYRAPGGERLEELQDRVVESINEIAERHPKETVVVATHGGPIRAFFCHAIGTDLRTFRKIRLDNCGITTFSLDGYGNWFLEVMNDTYHMDSAWAQGCSMDETSVIDKAF